MMGRAKRYIATVRTAPLSTMEKAGMKHVSTEKNALEVDGMTYDKLIYEYEFR